MSRCDATYRSLALNPETTPAPGATLFCFRDPGHTGDHRAEGGFTWPNQAERAERLADDVTRKVFADLKLEENAGEPSERSLQVAILGRMLESLEKHDAVQERTAKAFEAIAEHLGNVRILFDLKKPRRVGRRRRRAKKGAAK